MKFLLDESNKIHTFDTLLLEDAKDDEIARLKQLLVNNGININDTVDNQVLLNNLKDFSKKVKQKANKFINSGMSIGDLYDIPGMKIDKNYQFRLLNQSISLVYNNQYTCEFDDKTNTFKKYNKGLNTFTPIRQNDANYNKYLYLFDQSIKTYGDYYLRSLDDQYKLFLKNELNLQKDFSNNADNKSANSNDNKFSSNENNEIIKGKLRPKPAELKNEDLLKNINTYIDKYINSLLQPFYDNEEDPEVDEMDDIQVNRNYSPKLLTTAYMSMYETGLRGKKRAYLSVSNIYDTKIYLQNNDLYLVSGRKSTSIAKNSKEYDAYLYLMYLAIHENRKDFPEKGKEVIIDGNYNMDFINKLKQFLSNSNADDFLELKALKQLNKQHGFDQNRFKEEDRNISGFIKDFNKIINRVDILLQGKTEFTLPKTDYHPEIEFTRGIYFSKLFESANFKVNLKGTNLYKGYGFNSSNIPDNAQLEFKIPNKSVNVSVSDLGQFLLEFDGNKFAFQDDDKSFYLLRADNSSTEIQFDKNYELFVTLIYVFDEVVKIARKNGYLENINTIADEIKQTIMNRN